MKTIVRYILKPLTIIGALNWGLIGIFGFDIVVWLFGPATILSRIIYSIIGISALLWIIIKMFVGKTDMSCEYKNQH